MFGKIFGTISSAISSVASSISSAVSSAASSIGSAISSAASSIGSAISSAVSSISSAISSAVSSVSSAIGGGSSSSSSSSSRSSGSSSRGSSSSSSGSRGYSSVSSSVSSSDSDSYYSSYSSRNEGEARRALYAVDRSIYSYKEEEAKKVAESDKQRQAEREKAVQEIKEQISQAVASGKTLDKAVKELKNTSDTSAVKLALFEVIKSKAKSLPQSEYDRITEETMKMLVRRDKSPEEVVKALEQSGVLAKVFSSQQPQQKQEQKDVVAKIAEAAEKTVLEPLKHVIQKDLEARYGKDHPDYRRFVESEKKISDALQAYTAPLSRIAAKSEAEGNPLAAAFAGFVEGATTMLAAPLAIGEQIIEKTKEKGIVGTGEAVKDVAVGTVEWIAGIPGRLASGRASEIGKVAGEIAAGAIAGKVMEAPLKTVGKTVEAVKFRQAEHIPLEKITQPEVAKGEASFPFVREIVRERGEKKFGERATPEKAVETTIKQFYETPAKEMTEVGRESPAAGFHATPDVTSFKKESYTVKGAEKRELDVAGQYIAPEVSPHFLRLATTTETLNPVTAIKSAIETVKERGVTELIKSEIREAFGLPTKAGILHIGLEGVKRVPEEFRGSLESMKEFFRTGVEKGTAEKGYAYIEPKTELFKTTGEVQAVIPHGAVIERFPGKTYYTVVEGKKVPIHQFKYRAEEAVKTEIKAAESKLREVAEISKEGKEGLKKEIMTIEEASRKYSPTPYKRFDYRPAVPATSKVPDVLSYEAGKDTYSEEKATKTESEVRDVLIESRAEPRIAPKRPKIELKIESEKPEPRIRIEPDIVTGIESEKPKIESDITTDIVTDVVTDIVTDTTTEPKEPDIVTDIDIVTEPDIITEPEPKIESDIVTDTVTDIDIITEPEIKSETETEIYTGGGDILTDLIYGGGGYKYTRRRYAVGSTRLFDDLFRWERSRNMRAAKYDIGRMMTFKKNPVGELLFGKLRL